jgi:hypothetical protein
MQVDVWHLKYRTDVKNSSLCLMVYMMLGFVMSMVM